jgi:CheY-like chemotaxis protein
MRPPPVVCVIDDDEYVRLTLCAALTYAGFQTVQARDGACGLDAIARANAAVAVIDLIMPGKEGLETIIEAKARFPDLKILAVTGGGRLGSPRTSYRSHAKSAPTSAWQNRSATTISSRRCCSYGAKAAAIPVSRSAPPAAESASIAFRVSAVIPAGITRSAKAGVRVRSEPRVATSRPVATLAQLRMTARLRFGRNIAIGLLIGIGRLIIALAIGAAFVVR